jgi:crotonobetaine/carnitine-CoA ligase
MACSSTQVDFLRPGVVRITLNRPSALNAINTELLDSFTKALRDHQNARIILIEGAGDRSFCAGEDLKQTLAPRTGSAQELRAAFSKLQDITRLTSSSQAIVITAVQGYAIGGGAEIALAADFVIGGPKSKFRFPEVTLGHAVTGGISLRLTQLVGLLRAKELLITGRWVDAMEALRLGILTEIAEDPKHRAEELALELAKLPAAAMSCSKVQLERAVFTNMEACLQDEVNVASYCFAQSDASQAFANFATRKALPSNRASNSVTVANNDNHQPHNRIRDINTAFHLAVNLFPDRTFIRMAGTDLSFAQCNSTIGKLAGGLQQIGIKRNDRVLVMMHNSVEMVYSWLAANRLGAVFVPINVQLKSVTLKHAIKAADPKIVIVDADLQLEFEALGVMEKKYIYVKGGNQASSNSLSRLMDAGEPIERHVEVTPATTAAFLYTSGTTGRSKPCVLSHEYFILQARALIEGCSLRQDDVLYCPFPLFHADATALTVVPAMLLGAVAALSVRFSASKFWDEIHDTGATIYDFMGATLALTYKQPPSPRDRDHRVRLAWGVPIPYFAKDYEDRFGHSLVTLYGSVEASLPIFQKGNLPFGSCGRLRDGYQLRIADDMDEEVSPNTPGQLLLRSDQPNAFFGGYFNDPENTVSAFRSLWMHTGDLARVDEVGNIYFLGRMKDVIRRRGENVNASEIEEEFLQHPDVVIAAAYGIPCQFGEGTEEDIKVAVQTKEGSEINERALWEWARKEMARFQVPDVIERVREIRRTPTGKVEKYGLRMEGGVRFDMRKR